MSNFKQDYLQGKTTYESFSKYVDTWHKSSTTKSLQEFLGLNDHEYHLMLKDDGSLEKELNKSKKVGTQKEDQKDQKDHKAASQLKKALAKIVYSDK